MRKVAAWCTWSNLTTIALLLLAVDLVLTAVYGDGDSATRDGVIICGLVSYRSYRRRTEDRFARVVQALRLIAAETEHKVYAAEEQ